MKKFAALLPLVAVTGLFLIGAPEQAEARPQYLKAFVGSYDIEEAKALKCGVCHGEGGKNKKVTSDYGMALFAALGGSDDDKNCKDEDRINAALKKTEAVKSGDTTYGEILKSGKLPPMAP
jgi:hypothetical protein